MGMSITEDDEMLCVELDSRSMLTTYEAYIPSFDGTPQNLKFEISDFLFTEPNSNPGVINQFSGTDQMMG